MFYFSFLRSPNVQILNGKPLFKGSLLGNNLILMVCQSYASSEAAPARHLSQSKMEQNTNLIIVLGHEVMSASERIRIKRLCLYYCLHVYRAATSSQEGV